MKTAEEILKQFIDDLASKDDMFLPYDKAKKENEKGCMALLDAMEFYANQFKQHPSPNEGDNSFNLLCTECKLSMCDSCMNGLKQQTTGVGVSDIDELIERTHKKQKAVLDKYNALTEKEQFKDEGVELQNESKYYTGKLQAFYYIKSKLSQQPPTTGEVDAVKFAEWISDNAWFRRLTTHPKHIGKYWSDIHCEYKTIEQLYELYKSETNRL